MKKVYVLDTNILLSDPNAIYAFGDNDVVIPAVCLSELDSKKKQMDEIGANARSVARELDRIREDGKLHQGVKLRTGGTLTIITHNPNSPMFEKFVDINNDDYIISVAYDLSERSLDTKVILLSKDILVRIKADTVSVTSEDYQQDKVAVSESDLYQGYSELYVDDEVINFFYRSKYLDREEFSHYPENHMFVLRSNTSESMSAVCRKKDGELIPLYNYMNNPVFGIRHKSVEQMMALELLLDDDVKIVTLSGKAGTGKTLLALASALHKTLDEQMYRKVLVARPIVPMGKDLGYLPGEKEEKLRPWMQPIYDNLEVLFGSNDELELDATLAGYEDIIKVEALTYIRGRNIPYQYIILDEAQNLNKLEAKTIATRLAEGAKLVMVGDPEQIDHPHLDMYSNGLTHVIERLKGQKEVGHITLKRGERSTIAQICADLL